MGSKTTLVEPVSRVDVLIILVAPTPKIPHVASSGGKRLASAPNGGRHEPCRIQNRRTLVYVRDCTLNRVRPRGYGSTLTVEPVSSKPATASKWVPWLNVIGKHPVSCVSCREKENRDVHPFTWFCRKMRFCETSLHF